VAAERLTVGVRIQRLLAMLQWIAPAGSEGVEIDELCERFGIGRAELVRELEMASMINAESVDYDEMPFEVIVEDGRVFARLFSFDRPMRLTPAEGLALVAAADALLGAGDDDTPLRRALTKLAGLLGLEPGESVGVDLDPGGGDAGRALADAIGRDRAVRFRYWSYGRDVVGERTVDPWTLTTADGLWYLAGHDHGAGAERIFRLDRLDGLLVLDDPRSTAPPADHHVLVGASSRWPRAVLDLPAHARWVADSHPVDSVEPLAGGRLRVTLGVTDRSWLERLVLRIGGDVAVVSLDPDLGDGDVAASGARRVLARYRDGAPAATH